MQDNFNPAQFMGLSVFGDASGRLGDYVGRNAFRTAAPTLISAFVHIKVITGEIAPTVHFEYELIRGQEHAAVHV